jgi:hypothetical protein
MKRAILYVLFGASFLMGAVVCMGVIGLSFDCSPDNYDVRERIRKVAQNKAEFAAAEEETRTFCQTLQRVGEGGFDTLFGKPSKEFSFFDLYKRAPSDYAIPVFENSNFAIGGLGYTGNNESRFYAISDIGGVLMLPRGDDGNLSAVFLYLKIDNKFIPIESVEDYRARIDWDKAKLKRLRSWIEKQAKEKGVDLHKYKP